MHQAIDASRKGVADGRLVDAAEVRRRFGQSGTGAVFGSGSQKLAPVPDFPSQDSPPQGVNVYYESLELQKICQLFKRSENEKSLAPISTICVAS